MSIQNVQSAYSSLSQVQRPQEVVQRPFVPSPETEMRMKAASPSAMPADESLTQDERSFFEELFPSAAQQIREYHAYGRDGSRVAVTTGTVVDRRG